MMTGSMQLVRNQAERCGREGVTIPVPDLAPRLTAAGHLTGYGTPYKGGRGTYRLVRATYHRLIRAGLRAEAEMVARAFTRPDGRWAWQR
jgi:hypothetical protein